MPVAIASVSPKLFGSKTSSMKLSDISSAECDELVSTSLQYIVESLRGRRTFDEFVDDILTSSTTRLVRCKCRPCMRKGHPSPWKKEKVPSPIEYVFEFNETLEYIHQIADSINDASRGKILDLAILFRAHGLVTPSQLKSMKAVVEGVAHMDFMRSMLGTQQLTEVVDEAIPALEEFSEKFGTFADAVSTGVDQGMPALNTMAAAMHGLNVNGVNSPSLDNLTSQLRDGVNVNVKHSVDTSWSTKVMETMASTCKPLRAIYDAILKFGSDHKQVKDLLCMIAATTLETIRLRLSPQNKWYNLLGLAAAAIALLGNSFSRDFAIGYYGTTILIAAGKWFLKTYNKGSDDDEESDEEPIFARAHSDLSPTTLVDYFFEGIVGTITGITSKLTLRDIAASLVLYKTLKNGVDFAIDSFANLCIDFLNLLSKPFGFTLFKSTYGKYPVLFSITEHFNAVKAKLADKKEITRKDIEMMYAHRNSLTVLDVTIPINSEHSVYRNMVSKLQGIFDKLEIQLRGLGLMGDRRRYAPLVITLLGGAGTGKTNYAKILLELLVANNYPPEILQQFKDFPDALLYSFKIKKFNEGLTSLHKFIIMDDLGQIKGVKDPESCPYVQLVSIVNNEPFAVNKAAAEAKDNVYIEPDIIFVTSNLRKYDPDTSYAVESEAPIRRMESTNRCCFVIEPNPEYRIKLANGSDSGGAWGYKVNKDLYEKGHYNVNQFKIRSMNFRNGVMADVVMDHKQFVTLLDTNFKKHFKREHETRQSITDIYLNPEYNPWIAGPINAKAHGDNNGDGEEKSDPPRLLDHDLADIDVDEMDENELRLLFKSKQRARAFKHVPTKKSEDFEDVNDYIAYLFHKRKDNLATYYARGHSVFGPHVAQIVWGQINNESWAHFAAENHAALSRAIVEYAGTYANGQVSLATWTSIGQMLSPTEVYPTFKMYALCARDMAMKFFELGKIYARTAKSIYNLLRDSNVSWKTFAEKSVAQLRDVICVTGLVTLEAATTSLAMYASFRNVWIEIFIAALPVVIVACRTAKAVAHSDYEKMGKVLKNPLSGKCKHSKLKKSVCSCVECVKVREDNPLTAVKKAFHTTTNDDDASRSVSSRNVFNMQLFVDRNSKSPIMTQNITMIHTRLGVTNDHFVGTLFDLVDKYPTAIVRIVNFVGHVFAELNARIDMGRDTWKRCTNVDKAFWINNRMRAFGGGLRNRMDMLWSEKDRLPSMGRICLMRRDKETGNMTVEFTPVVFGKSFVAYKSDHSGFAEYRHHVISCNVESQVGHCGAPAWSADDKIKPTKMLGLICSGSPSTSDKKMTFLTSITREEVEAINIEFDLALYDTSLCPDDVVDTDVIPKSFLVSRIEADEHPVNNNNPNKKTPFHGCIGESECVPCFVAPWIRNDGKILDGLAITRAKNAKTAPPTNAILYGMAGAMTVATINSVLPPGPRAFRLTTEEALNGAYGEAPFSVKTSPGGKYILEGITKKSIVKRSADQLDFSSPNGQRFLQDVEDRTKAYENNVILPAYINEFAKAEVLPRDKVYEGKTRLVCGDDADAVIADKKEIACCNYLLKQTGLGAGLMIGIDPFSKDTHVQAVLLSMWNQISDADYGGWDTSYFLYKLLMVARCFEMLLFDMTPLHRKAFRTAVESFTYRVHIAHILYTEQDGSFEKRRVFYEWVHGMISGSYLTLIFNTMGNAIDHRYAMLICYVEKNLGVDYLEYDPVIHGMVPFMEIECNQVSFHLGDDLTFSKSPYINFITFESLQWAHARHNIKYTSATKEDSGGFSRIEPYSTKPSKAQFCKRWWQWCPEYHRYVAVLVRESRLKMIYYSEDFSEYEQIIDTWFQETARAGREEFERDAPSVNRIALICFSYSSPYSIYELALAAAVSGTSTELIRKLRLAIDEDLLTPEEALYVTDSAGLALSLETKLPLIEADPLDLLNRISKSTTNNTIETIGESSHASHPDLRDDSDPEIQVPDIAEARMDAPIIKERMLTTTMIAETEVSAESYGPREVVDGYSHEYSDLKSFLERPIVVADNSWQQTDNVNDDILQFPIETIMVSVKTWMNKLAGFNLMRGTAVIRVQINANVFQQGRLRLHFIPNTGERASYSSLNKLIIQKTQHPGVDLDCRNSSCVLRIPYVAPTHYFDLTEQTYGWGTVYLTVLSQLRTGMETAVSTVQYTVWMSFEDVEVAAPVAAIAHGDRDESAVNARPISTTLRKAGTVAGTLSTIPMVKDYAKPLAWALNASARAAYSLGYAKPMQNDAMTLVSNMPNRYTAVSDGPDTAFPLGLSSSNVIPPSSIGSIRKEDEMSFAFLKSVDCQFTRGTWSTTQPSGFWGDFAIAPELFHQPGVSQVGGAHVLSVWARAPFAYVTKFFSAWRGGIVITVKFVKTQLVSGRLEFVFTPGTSLSGGTLDQNVAAIREIVDVRFSDEVVLKLPWLITQNYLGPLDPMGTLTINILNPLKAPDACSTVVDMLFYVHADDDYEVAGPTPVSYVGPPVYTPQPVSLAEEFEVVPAVAHMDKVIVEEEVGGQNEPPLTTQFAEQSQGEMFTSVKQLITRYTLWNTKGATPTSATFYVNPFYTATTALTSSSGVMLSPDRGGDVYSAISAMYGSYRGGMKIAVHSASEVLWMANLVNVAQGPGTYIGTARNMFSTAWPFPGFDAAMSNGIAMVPARYIYARVPYYADTLYSITNWALSNTQNTNPDQPYAALNVSFLGTPGFELLSRAADDDHQLSYFISTPLQAVSYA